MEGEFQVDDFVEGHNEQMNKTHGNAETKQIHFPEEETHELPQVKIVKARNSKKNLVLTHPEKWNDNKQSLTKTSTTAANTSAKKPSI